jgi:hypothetical protein
MNLKVLSRRSEFCSQALLMASTAEFVFIQMVSANIGLSSCDSEFIILGYECKHHRGMHFTGIEEGLACKMAHFHTRTCGRVEDFGKPM